MSFDISSRSEHLPHRLFVEASAGTGKTYVIEHYIVRSLLAGPFDPQKLALITFTKAVARELRLRLRTTLQDIHSIVVRSCYGDIAEDDECIPDYLRPVLELDGFNKSTVARTIEEGIERLPSAMIVTIHGFCDRMVQAWGEETGEIGFEEWVGEEEKKTWLAEFLQEGAGITVGELGLISRKYWHDQERLIEHLIRLMDGLEGKKDTAWEDVCRSIEQVRVKIDGEKIAEALSEKAQGYRGNMKKDKTLRKEVLDAFLAIQQLVQNGVREEIIEKLLEFRLPECFETPLAKKTIPSFSTETIVDTILVDLWGSLQELIDADCIINRLAVRCATSFFEFVRKTGKKTPDMVVRRVLALSENREFLAFAAEKVDWLIVDEFQDTDAVQYTIFSRLFLDNPLWHGRVLFVGDPKQAIYGFRKADVYSYLTARQALQTHQIRTLAVNYRAEPAVVAAQNRLFAGPEHPQIFRLPKAMTSLDVVPCMPGRKAEEVKISDARGAFHLCLFRGNLGRKRRWPHDDMEQQLLFPWLADEMISVESLGIPFRRQAILVKDRYQAKRVQKFLEERHIPTCAWRVDAVTDSLIYPWLLKAFSIACRPNDQQRLSSLLLSIPTDEHLKMCRAMVSERRLDQWAACAVAWEHVREAFMTSGIGGMARALFECRWNGMETVEEWAHALPKGDELLIDMEHLFELLSLLEPVLPRSIEAYGDALEGLENYFSEEPEALIRRVNPDDEGAPILTMHRSKGLEFDVVYAIGAASRTPIQDEMAIDEADAEKLRQLYVCVTRARRRCYLPLLIDDDGKSITKGQASPVELLFAALSIAPVPSSSWIDALYESMASSSAQSLAHRLAHEVPLAISISDGVDEIRNLSSRKKGLSTPSERPLRPISGTGRLYSSCSSRKKDHEAAFFMPADEKGMNTPLFGTRFHEAMSSLLFAPTHFRDSLNGVMSWLTTNEQEDAELARLLFEALHVKLTLEGETVCLQKVPREDMRAECAFLDKESERYLRGVLDLVFLWKGAVYVVDWKTNDVKGNTLEEVVRREYDLQHQMYMDSAIKAFVPEFRYGGFFFVFVRHLHHGGIIPGGALCTQTR